MESGETPKGIEVKESLPWLKVIIVEDQGWPQATLLQALHKVLGDRIKDFTGGDVLLINNYSDMVRLLKNGNSKDYDFVLLDNVLTREPIPETERGKSISVRIEGVDPNAFSVCDDPQNYSDYPKENGYSLIPAFKEQGILVIGTSSMSLGELREKALPEPDFLCSKLEYPGSEIGSNLRAIMPAVATVLKDKKSKR